MTFSAIATVSSKNQFTIPIDMVKYLNISQGTKLAINLLDDNSLRIEPLLADLYIIRNEMQRNPLVKKYSKYTSSQILKIADKLKLDEYLKNAN